MYVCTAWLFLSPVAVVVVVAVVSIPAAAGEGRITLARPNKQCVRHLNAYVYAYTLLWGGRSCENSE